MPVARKGRVLGRHGAEGWSGVPPRRRGDGKGTGGGGWSAWRVLRGWRGAGWWVSDAGYREVVGGPVRWVSGVDRWASGAG